MGTDGREVPAKRWYLAWGILALVAALFVGFASGWLVTRPHHPGDDSAEAGFLRDMSAHHAQAIEMGMIAYQRGESDQVRTIGGDIALTQRYEIGIMQTWLRDWGLLVTGSQPPMAWMPEGDRAIRPGSNLMPGMATSAEMDKLRKAKGKELDILFCQLMLNHHLGGIHMAEGILKQSKNEDVRRLANGMKIAQTGEVATLRSMLTELGAPS